jgi:hypothetical protein
VAALVFLAWDIFLFSTCPFRQEQSIFFPLWVVQPVPLHRWHGLEFEFGRFSFLARLAVDICGSLSDLS